MKLDKCCHTYIYKKTDLEQKKEKFVKSVVLLIIKILKL